MLKISLPDQVLVFLTIMMVQTHRGVPLARSCETVKVKSPMDSYLQTWFSQNLDRLWLRTSCTTVILSLKINDILLCVRSYIVS